jgi:glucose-6-phosphate-specific signal transduction histidine kinase
MATHAVRLTADLKRLTMDLQRSRERLVIAREEEHGLPPSRRVGVGLVSMRERAEELGGTWTIEPVESGGPRVLARLPYARSETADTLVVTTSRVSQEEK